jgi:hypothetical protein
LPLCVPPLAEQKRLVNKFFNLCSPSANRTSKFWSENCFLISKIPIKSLLLPSPYKIVAFAEPEPRTRMNSVRDKLREGEAIPFQKAEIVKWRCLLDKIRTYFEQNPDADF